MKDELGQILNKLHTTPMGAERIKRNLGLRDCDIAAWVTEAIKTAEKSSVVTFWQKGKNWYIHTPDIGITVNAGNFCIITAHKLKTKVRTMNEADYEVLREFLYQAVYIPEGKSLPPRSLIDDPNIIIYIKDFGKQAGDLGIVAEVGGQIIGAAWTRIIPAYGHLDNDTPELAISLFPEYRGKGIGTKLMKALFELLRNKGYKRTSLSVQKNNPAVRFYERLGYKVSGERLDHAGHEDFLMVKELTNSETEMETVMRLTGVRDGSRIAVNEIVKAIEGASPEQMKRAAEEAVEAVSRSLGKPKKYFSVAFENYTFGEWEGVYNECIKDNDSVALKPEYTNPKTFQ